MCSQKVRRMKVMRLSGDKANPYNRMKKNRLCGLVVCAEIENYVSGFPCFLGFLSYLKSRKTRKTWKTQFEFFSIARDNLLCIFG